MAHASQPPTCPNRAVRRAAVVAVAMFVGWIAWSAQGPVAATAPPDSPPPTTVPPASEPDADQGVVIGGDAVDEQVDATPDTLPLLPEPAGCTAPPLPHVVFLGTVVAHDYRTVDFRIDTVRGGEPAPYVNADGVIGVRFGSEAQYLAVGQQYLVSAMQDPDLGLLVSRLTPPVEDFGGDEVIGVNESDIRCPDYEDPERTLYPDGSAVETNILEPLIEARGQLLAALLLPVGVAFGAIFALSLVRISLNGVARFMFRR